MPSPGNTEAEMTDVSVLHRRKELLQELCEAYEVLVALHALFACLASC